MDDETPQRVGLNLTTFCKIAHNLREKNGSLETFVRVEEEFVMKILVF